MEFIQIVDFSTYLNPVILFIGIGIGFYFYKTLDNLHKTLTYYLVSMFILDILSRIIGFKYGNNLVFIPIGGFFELLGFSVFYYFLGIKESVIKKWALIATVFFTFMFALWEILKVYNAPVEEFESYTTVIATLFVVIMALAFFLGNILKRKEISTNIFMLNSGILIFFSLILIIFLPIDFLIHDNTGLKFYFWFANLIFTLVFYTFLNLSIWKNGKIQE